MFVWKSLLFYVWRISVQPNSVFLTKVCREDKKQLWVIILALGRSNLLICRVEEL